MYFDEDLVLDLRLNVLNNYVDKFVIAEATKDHTGKDKKLNFDIKNFLKFENKIEYIIVDDLPMNLKSFKKTGQYIILEINIKEMHFREGTKIVTKMI